MPKQRFLQDISGLQNLRTLRGEHMGSIPRIRRAHFLDLYLQEKEKERLEQELNILNKKTLLIQKKLEKTLENINRIRGFVNAEEAKESSPIHANAIKIQKYPLKKRSRR